jgi:hypothetical protein
MVFPPPPPPGGIYLDEDAVQRILAQDSRIPPLDKERLLDVTAWLNGSARTLIISVCLKQVHPEKATALDALECLGSAATSLAERALAGRALGRQQQAVCKAIERLPGPQRATLANAAAPEASLDAGEARLRQAFKVLVDARCTTDCDGREQLAKEAFLVAKWAAEALEAWRRAWTPWLEKVGSTRELVLAVLIDLDVRVGVSDVMSGFHAGKRIPPTPARQAETKANRGGAPGGASFRFIKAFFEELRASVQRQPELAGLAEHPGLNPKDETIVEWIETARLRPRRFRDNTWLEVRWPEKAERRKAGAEAREREREAREATAYERAGPIKPV